MGTRDAVSMDDAIEHLVDSSFKSLKRTFTLVPHVFILDGKEDLKTRTSVTHDSSINLMDIYCK